VKTISIIGSGNVATVFSKKLFEKGFLIKQVWSRNIENALTLAHQVNAQAINSIEDLDFLQDAYFVAVNDSCISEITQRIHLNDKLIFHTAGSISSTVLQKSSKNYAVLYPLISIHKTVELPDNFPLFITSSNKFANTFVNEIAMHISNNVQQIDDENRLQIHLAAVFASNFSNHMFAISNELVNKSNFQFDILKPLIFQSIQKLKNNLPIEVQTGPAVRNDFETMQKHLELLKLYPELKELYLSISKNIQNYHHNK
jgi:predicted short-subunit dehydrogenase-like oxidoreductase (DUF2520 family)